MADMTEALEQGRQHSEQMVRRLLAYTEPGHAVATDDVYAVKSIIAGVACYDATQARFLDALLSGVMK